MGLLEDAHARAFGANHRWISLVLGICVQLCAGSLYAVNAWGQPLKEAAGWSSDEDLSLATTAGTLGVYLAVHNGLLMDRFGARPCLVAGAATLLVGYESLAAIARDGGSPGAAALALYLVGQGSVTAFLCSLAPNVGNFARGAQGRAHGVLLAGFGGSSALFATAFRGAFRDRLSAFFRAAGWITCATCLVAALVSKDGSKTQPESAGEDAPEDARRLFSAPNSTEAVTTPTTTNVATFANARDSAPAETTTDAGDRIDGETWRALFRARLFWCVYAHLVLSLGVALLWVNQAGSFAAAATGEGGGGLAAAVIFFSLGNVAGRLACGAASDAAERRWGTPRSTFLVVGAAGMGAGVAALAAAPASRGARLASAATVGLAEGTIMAAWTSTVRDAFGAERFGMHLAVFNSAIAVGSAAFNGFAAAATAAAGENRDAETRGYRATFAVGAVACAAAGALGVAATREVRKRQGMAFAARVYQFGAEG